MKKIALWLVVAVIILLPVCAQALSIGVWNEWPTLGMQINNNLSGYIGFNSMGGVSGASSTNWYLVKLDYNLSKIGEVQTKAGIYYYANSTGAGAAGDPSSAVGLTYGGSIMLAKNLSVGFDELLVQANSNPSSTDILPRATASVNFYL